MNGRAAEQPVLILAAGSDIARATARAFAAAGHPMQLAARRPEELEALKADLGVRYGVEVSLHRFDALETETHDDFFAGLEPKPHVVICAVGLLGNQAEAERDPAAANLIMRTNYVCPALALEAAARCLAAIEAPTAIVGIGSVAGERGRAVNYYYGSAKAGFHAFLSGLRQRLSHTGVRVITVKPGYVRTQMTADMDLPPALTADPQDIAAAIRQAVDKSRPVVVPWKWRAIMAAIRLMPERIFMKMRF